MKWAAFALALCLPAMAAAQSAGPAKLVIVWIKGDVVVTDYPTMARCQQGRAAIEAKLAQLNEQSEANARAMGDVIIGRSPARAFCIPG